MHISPIKRRVTRKIRVGSVYVGGDAPISVQTMTNTDTCDVAATVAQIQRCVLAGADIVRVSVPSMEAAEAFGLIRQQVQVPLVADIHFDHKIALAVAEKGADCLRINPGNIGSDDKVREVVACARDKGLSIRIGVNAGSLEKDLQKKYGEHRVFDTGIRECTIIGQAIGIAMRGLRPIAEIQYLDYLLYALQIMSDDLATVQYRTKGGQKAPVIIRTRGHRLEGIWHSGSPMGMIINAIRGIYVCVPRSMTIAAGFYNTLLTSDEPALVIEPLNSYRLKEKAPSNFGEFKLPLGIPEILKQGNDVTLVTYGSNCRIAMEAAAHLEKKNISVEVIDVQTLLPFDIHHSIVESLKKTNRIVFLDEDVPGGSTAFMMQKVLEEQGGYNYLDTEPKTITSKEHRPAYGSDGDYFSKPNVEDIVEAIYNLMHESNPANYPALY